MAKLYSTIFYIVKKESNKKALIVVDVQNGFIKNDGYKAVSKKIELLAKNKTYDKIFFTKMINDKSKNSFFEEKNMWFALRTKQEQDICFKLPKNAIVLEKYGFGLQQKDIENIKSLNIQEIDVCGFKSEACVYAISFQLWDALIYPNILINYVYGNVDMKRTYTNQFGKVDERE